ncbi:MAG: glycosyl hydrolase family 18 protein [Cellulosilyticaceae bacterium]
MIKKLFLGIVVLVIIGISIIIADTQMPSKENINPLTYFDEFKSNQQNMVFEDTRVDWDMPVIEKNEEIYIESTWANKFISDYLFYDEDEEIFSIATLEEVIRVNVNTNQVIVNNKPDSRTIPLIKDGNRLYIGESYIEELFGFDIKKGNDGRLVCATDLKIQKQTAEVTSRKDYIRTKPDKKSPSIGTVLKGDKLLVYSENNGYLRVRDENGIVGYIKENKVKITGETVVKEDKKYEIEPIKNPLNDKVKMVWDQMTVTTAGDWNSKKYEPVKHINVISPTWFEFADEEGNLISRVNKDYLNAAHNRGIQVWALMSHNFTKPQYTREILISTTKRQHVIDQLVEAVVQYDLDGINIDIENIQEDFSAEWVQFMRELYPQLRAVGATVSVDIYMPSAWSKHYRRDAIGEVVDYFIVMAYDQHWSGSEEAGPTAGINWIEEGLVENLKEVPNHKLVLGIPFFTRLWEESEDQLISKPLGIDSANKMVQKWKTEIFYDQEHANQYTETTKDGVTKKIWLEDMESMKKRIELIQTYNLAGFSSWKLGLENHEVWDILKTVK